MAGAKSDAVPESPIFRNTERVEVQHPVLHVNGVPVPPELAHAIPYANTDEGRAERPVADCVVSVVHDELSKKIQQRGDFKRSNLEVWEAPDPMKELADRHVQPGFSPKFLSPARIARDGMRGFEAVRDERGDPVKLGNLVLGQMPVEVRDRRNLHYQKKHERLVESMNQQIQQEQERFERDELNIRPSGASRREPDDEGLQFE